MRYDIGPSCHLPGGAGGGKGPYYRLTISVGSGGVILGLCYRVSGSRFSPRTRLLRPQRAHGDQLTRTHPDLSTTKGCKADGDGAEVNGKERGGGRRGGKSCKSQKQQARERKDGIEHN